MSKAPALCLHGSAAFAGEMIFKEIKLEASAGEWTCLLGSSGVGKTTVLRLFAGLEDSIDFEGTCGANDGPLDGRVALMAQSDLLLPWLSAAQNIALGAKLRGEAASPLRVAEVLDRVGLSDKAASRPAQLSGGQRQRVALARTLMEDRPVILLDEPFSALDAKTRAQMQELAAELLQGRTVLLVTHDPAEAARLGHRIKVMMPHGIIDVSPPTGAVPRGFDNVDVLNVQTRLLAQLRSDFKRTLSGFMGLRLMRGWQAGLVSAILMIGLWQLLVTLTGWPRFILPGPALVAETIWKSKVLLFEHAIVTISEILIGLALGAGLGGLSAIGLAASSMARSLVRPMLIFSQTIPIFALAPILTLWLGYGLASKVAMALLIIYFPVTSSFFDALMRTNADWLGLAKVMGAKSGRVMWHIRIPAALPGFASGLRLAAVYAPIGAIIGEWVGASQGLGYLMLLANGRVKIDLMFASLIVLAIFTILLHAAINFMANRLLEAR